MKSSNTAFTSTLGLGAMLLASLVTAQDFSSSDTGSSSASTVADTPSEPALPETESNSNGPVNTTIGRFATAAVTGEVNANFRFTWEEGKGVQVQITNMSNFGDLTLGNYSYSINTDTISGDQADQALRCAGTQGRLDPANVTNNVICDRNLAEYCQLGDLSGKHGRINATEGGKPEDIEYLDEYLRFYPQPFSLLGRSVVVEGSDGKRLACGNVISLLDGTANEAGLPTNKKSSYQNDYSSNAFKPPTTAINIAINGTAVNTKAFADAGLVVPPELPAVSKAPGVVLTQVSDKPAIIITSYSTSGNSLPTQALPDSGAFTTIKISAGLGLAAVLGVAAMLT